MNHPTATTDPAMTATSAMERPLIDRGAKLDPSEIGVLDEFQTELVDAWRQVPDKGFFFGLLAAWLALFHFLGNPILGYIHSSSLFAWMWEAYTSKNSAAENDRHGLVIPLVVLALMFWKRKELLSTTRKLWPPAFGLVLIGILFHLAGFALQEPRLSVVGLFGGIYGLMGLTWGPGWLRNSFFPFFLFAFAMPMGDNLGFITVKLQLLVCRLVEIISHAVHINVLREGTKLIDPTGRYQYEVAAACSGIRSLLTIMLFSTAYGFLVFRSWWKRGVLVLAAFPFAVLGNTLRMLCIIIAAKFGGQSAGNYVHDGGPGGIISLLPYIPAFFGVFWLGGILEKKKKSPASPDETAAPVSS